MQEEVIEYWGDGDGYSDGIGGGWGMGRASFRGVGYGDGKGYGNTSGKGSGNGYFGEAFFKGPSFVNSSGCGEGREAQFSNFLIQK